MVTTPWLKVLGLKVLGLKVLALTLTALSLVPVGAHLFELPNKIGTDRDAYFAIQQIYAGWARPGAPAAVGMRASSPYFSTPRSR